jgi:transcriptional regulator with XRE-family HTH domain
MAQRGYTIVDEFRPPPIGGFVRSVREARHLSQAELARRCNLSRAYINALESGNVKEPSARTLGLLARALEIDIMEMLEATGTVKISENHGIQDEAQLSSYLRRERKLSEPSIRSVLHLISLFELGDKQGEKKAETKEAK